MPFLTLGAPLWLGGLLLLPVIRWLHRGGQHRRAVPVSRQALWRAAASASPAAGERRPPDPAWRRRALLAALLCLALAEPQWPGARTRLTLWVDDSLSMLTREAGGTRLAVGLAQARSLLDGIGPSEVEVRTLADPWRTLGALDDASIANLQADAGRREPAAPPAALLRRDRLHWLLTDGADAAVYAWPGDARPDRVIQVAGITRNVGLERLAARRNLEDPDKLNLLIKLTNGGGSDETRTLAVTTDAGEQALPPQRLAPGTSVLVSATIPAAASVRATLLPADALPEDDTLGLDLGPLRRRRVAVDATCPPRLVAAVAAHPALRVAPGDAIDVQAALDCGARVPDALATIRVRADQLPRPPAGTLLWSAAVPESDRVRLAGERLRVAARLRPGPADAVLLAAGDEPLVVARAGAVARIETSIDFSAPGAGDDPAPALLVDWMFGRLFGSHLLNAIAITDRGPAASRVVPVPRALVAGPAREADEARFVRAATRPLLILAGLVLLWVIAALALQWRRLGGSAGAVRT